jgi:hypothetical protein
MGTRDGRADARSRWGRWLAMLGGAVCAVGYLLPWVRYHVAWEGSVFLPSGIVGHAWSGLRSLQNDVWPVVPYAVSGPFVLLVAALPLLMALVASGVGTALHLRGTRALSPGISWAYPAATALGTLALLVMTYALDPANLRRDAVDAANWTVPPSLEPGIFLAYAGVVAISVSWFLLRGRHAGGA